jgi:hypothetical protein
MFMTAADVTPIFLPTTRSPDQAPLQHALLNVVRVLDGDAGVAVGERLDHAARGHGLVELVAQGVDEWLVHRCFAWG